MPETRESLQDILSDATPRFSDWLDRPDDEASRGLNEVRQRLEALKGPLGASASAALRELAVAETVIRRSRQHQIAVEICKSLREIGIRLEPGAPLKRQPRKRSKPPAPRAEAAAAAQPAGEGSPPSASTSEPKGESEPRGVLSRLRTAR